MDFDAISTGSEMNLGHKSFTKKAKFRQVVIPCCSFEKPEAALLL